jgi:hypothetical protein
MLGVAMGTKSNGPPRLGAEQGAKQKGASVRTSGKGDQSRRYRGHAQPVVAEESRLRLEEQLTPEDVAAQKAHDRFLKYLSRTRGEEFVWLV